MVIEEPGTELYWTIILWARDFYRVIADEGAAQDNYHSQKSMHACGFVPITIELCREVNSAHCLLSTTKIVKSWLK